MHVSFSFSFLFFNLDFNFYGLVPCVFQKMPIAIELAKAQHCHSPDLARPPDRCDFVPNREEHPLVQILGLRPSDPEKALRVTRTALKRTPLADPLQPTTPWSVDSTDVREVILYRSGLVTAATSFVVAASAAFLPDSFFLTDIVKNNLDFVYAIGAGGLGLSLFLIHIYMTEIKRTLQAFWGLGVAGSFATYACLATPAGEGLVQYVVDNPVAIWCVGPLFASLTGLVFKESLCYGKLEAGILTFIIPTVLLGHLSGLMDDGAKLSLLGLWMALFVIFAGKKFTQPIKDDIGDKSVFTFNFLPENEKMALIQKLEQQKLSEDVN